MNRFTSHLVSFILTCNFLIAGHWAFSNDRLLSAQSEEQPSKEKQAKQLAEHIQKLIRQLDDDEFQVREKAEKTLIEIGPPAKKALEKAAESDSAEVKFRAKRALEKVRALSSRLRLVESVYHNNMTGMVSTTVSRDGKFLYAAGYRANAFTVFIRDTKTGTLKHLQTISDRNTMQGSVCLRLSPDGKYAAGTGFRSKSVLLFKRDLVTGKLGMLEVVQGNLGNQDRLEWPIECSFSPDSNFLYVVDPKGPGRGGGTGSVVCFRITKQHRLELVEVNNGKDNCFTGSRGLVMHPHGKTLYVPSSSRGLLTVLDRDPKTGKMNIRQILKDGENNIQSLNGVYYVACSSDGKFVYSCSGRFQGDQAVSVFKVAEDGSLSLVQELFNEQKGLRNCRGANEIHISPDGKHVCVAATVSGYVIDFQRDEKTGKLHDFETLRLIDEEGQLGPSGLGFSPDSRYIYAALEGAGEIAVLRFIDKKILSQGKR